MKTVGVRMEWVGEAEEVAVAGEFNGWVTVPLIKEKATAPPGSLWSVLLQIEPEVWPETDVTGCYTFKFLVDGDWKTREGDELEEDEKGELNAILVVEEDEEDEEEATVEEVKAAEAVKEAVERVEEDLDVLTLNFSLCGEKSFMEMTGNNEVVEKENEEDVAKMEELMEEDKVKENKEAAKSGGANIDATNKEAKKETVKEKAKNETVEKEHQLEIDEATDIEPVEAMKVEEKENNPKVEMEGPTKRVTRRSILPCTPTLPTTPKVVKEAAPKRVTRRSILPGTPTLPTTPKVATPTLRASQLDKVATDKVLPDEVESPRRLTRTALKNVKNN